jgi:hypothetical protein
MMGFNVARGQKLGLGRLSRQQQVRRRGVIALLSCGLSIVVNLAMNWVLPTVASPDWVKQSNAVGRQLSLAYDQTKCQGNGFASDAFESPALLAIDPGFERCRKERIRQVLGSIERDLTTTNNPELQLDLGLFKTAAQQYIRSVELNEKYQLSYVDLSKAILESLKETMAETVGTPKQAVLKQLEKYAGLGSNPALTVMVEKRIREKLQTADFASPNLELPKQEQFEKDLKKNAAQVDEIQSFLAQQNIPAYEPVYAQLKNQLFAYEMFLRRELLPIVKENFRLPIELYEFKLARQGIDQPITTVAAEAHAAFAQVQQQMDAIAPQIIRQKGLKGNGYRDVIRALQAEILTADASLKLYRQRGAEIDAMIQQHNLVTLPRRSLKIRLSTPKEDEDFPVPLYDGDAFVLPVLKDAAAAKRYNDFTNPAMSWTLTAHEGRPGHDLQIMTLREQKASYARRYFAFNAAHVEGWAVYGESILQPYMPIEGKFMSLQFQLLRSARAFLEPELQLGKITKAMAMRVLTEDAGFSPFFAAQEVNRYTAKLIAQAPAYFYGFKQFLSLRADVEKALGAKFKPQEFHDLILRQGELPPTLMRQVILAKIVRP